MAVALFGLFVLALVLVVPVVALVVALQNRAALRELRARLERLAVRAPGDEGAATGGGSTEASVPAAPVEAPVAQVELPALPRPPLPQAARGETVLGARGDSDRATASGVEGAAGPAPSGTDAGGGAGAAGLPSSGVGDADGGASARLPSIEELLTGRLAVWLGAVAVVLAVAFFVRYSIERGWIGERVRVGLGVLFGTALLVVGERMRASAERVASGLSAAGIAALFVSFYAAVELYGLVPAWVGFALLGLTAAAGVALSLRQGVIVAAIGLVGGMLTPWLVETRSSDPRILFAYLLLLEAGIFFVGRRRSWQLLPLAAVGGGLAWLVLWLEGPVFAPWNAAWLTGFVVLSCLAYGLTLPWRRAEPAGDAVRLPAMGAAGAGLLLTAVIVGAAGARPGDWVLLGIVSAAVLAVAFLREDLVVLAWLPPLLVAGVYGFWTQGEVDAALALTVGCAFGVGFALAAYAALWRWRRPALWAALSALSAILFALLVWSALREELEARWGLAAIALAVAFALAAVPVTRRRARAGGEEALAALAVAATTFAAFAVPLELDRAWLTVAWALEVALLVWLGDRLAVPALERLALALGVLVGVRLVLNPAVLDYPIGPTPVVDWLLWGYGVPVAAFLWSARRLRSRGGWLALARLLEWASLALVVVWSALEVHHVFHPDPASGGLSFREVASAVVVWQALGLALLALRERWPVGMVRLGGPLVATLGFAAAALGLGLIRDPLWEHDNVGAWPVANWTLWGFGLTSLLAGLASVRAPARPWAWLWRAVALGSGLAWLTFSVRQLFHGEYLDARGVTEAEGYAYSTAWVAAGIVLLILGVRRRSALLRWSALGLFGLAAGKVFLYDLGNLGGLWRVLSFLGLGASLFLLAWVYQRFVREAEE
ncbi:MAG: DUF2339 domain-containing protein [Thermoanaerobaculia bacterium]